MSMINNTQGKAERGIKFTCKHDSDHELNLKPKGKFPDAFDGMVEEKDHWYFCDEGENDAERVKCGVGDVVSEPTENGRDALGLVMERHGRQAPPHLASTLQFDYSASKHHSV